MYRLIKRRIKYNKKVRPSAAIGCKEALDFKFIKYAFWESRKRKSRLRNKEIENRYKDKIIVLKNRRQVKNYLKSCELQSHL